MIVCLPSVYLAVLIWVLCTNILFFIALNNSKGEIETLLQIRIIFDIVMFLSLPLLLMMTRGVCS